MNHLPFIKDNKWPTSKETPEKVVNKSYDAEFQEHSVHQLMKAMEEGDGEKAKDAIKALIISIMTEDKE